MRHATVAITLMALLCLGSNALAANEGTTLVLHALETAFGPCGIADPCPDPAVDVAAGTSQFIYLIVKNYDDVAAVQTAFDYGGNTFIFGLWDCQSNQVNGTVPTAAGGATAGTIASAFDCIQGGGSAVVGRIQVAFGSAGCVTQVESSFPFGNHVVSCTGTTALITDTTCWGSVCVDAGGNNACAACAPTAVEPSTWGSIKSQYN